MQKELESFAKELDSPGRPFLAIVGGAKVSDKIQLIEKMLDKVNSLILCDGMAFTFLKASKNMKIGDSLYDPNNDCEALALSLLEKAREKNVKVLLPIGFVIASEFKATPTTISYATDKEGIPDGMRGLDCGQESCKLFHDEIINCKTILWNGPPGVLNLKRIFQRVQNPC